MREGQQQSGDAAAETLLHPAYWLVSALDWPGADGTAEAAVAVAPGTIPREALSPDSHQILGCADLYARKQATRVVFFSDLTRMFTAAGTSWTQLGVDWEAGLRELQSGRFPALFLTISEHAYWLICDPVIQPPAGGLGEAAGSAGAERQQLRETIAHRLSADWPAYIAKMTAAGRLRSAG